MSAPPHLTRDFILERLEIIGGSADERESGNETIARMLAFLGSHKSGNEAEMKSALSTWKRGENKPKRAFASILLNELHL
jgi:hypothetical protein